MKMNNIPQRSASPKVLQIRGLLMVGLLIVEFFAGMVLNFFIELPNAHSGTSGNLLQRGWDGYTWSATSGNLALQIHLVIATILILGSIATLGFSIAARSKAWIVASSIGLVGVWLAFLNGLAFISTDQDKHSFAMATAFMIAFAAYSAGLYYGKTKTR